MVQIGDALDRGPGSRKVLDLLMKLEGQARRAGGGRESEPGRPPGCSERRRQFGPDDKCGRWIRAHNAIIKIDDTGFLHDGISPQYVRLSIRQINNQVRAELEDSS